MVNQILLEYIKSMLEQNTDPEQVLGALYGILSSHYGLANHANDNFKHEPVETAPVEKFDIIQAYDQAQKALVSKATSPKE